MALTDVDHLEFQTFSHHRQRSPVLVFLCHCHFWASEMTRAINYLVARSPQIPEVTARPELLDP